MLVEYAVLFEALVESKDPAVRMWMKQRLRTDLGVTDEAAIAQVPAALGSAAGAALRYLERQTDAGQVRALMRAAEERVDEAEIRAALVPRTRLSAAFEARLDALGAELVQGAADPSPDALMRAERRLHAVEGHSLAAEGDGVRHVERGWMAVRLLAWLAARPDAQLAHGAAPYDAVESLGQWYAEEGGYVDWARREARGTAGTAFEAGVQAAALDGRASVPIPVQAKPVSADRPQPKQLTLPVVVEPTPEPMPPKPATTTTKRPSTAPPSAFAQSKVLEARTADATVRKEVARAVDFLLSRNGAATAAAFAAEMSIVQRRAGGLVAKLQEVLNVDGYEVLRFDAATQQVLLDVGKLRLLFEVPVPA